MRFSIKLLSVSSYAFVNLYDNFLHVDLDLYKDSGLLKLGSGLFYTPSLGIFFKY